MRKFWTAEEIELVRQRYADTPTKDICAQIGRSMSGVYQLARKLGLLKSTEYMASPAACRLRRGDNVGSAYRFKKGIVPHNKGLRRPGWAPGRMGQTQFKKGQHPHTWRPVGSTRYSKEGYLQRKVSDTGYTPRDWKGVHILLWEEACGPVPAGHAVAFKDGNKENIVIGNLELISRGELMRRNTVHNLPKELAVVVQLRGALNRQIRRISGKEQARGLAGPSVRNVGSAEGSGQAHGD